MPSLAVATVAYCVASYFIKRYPDAIEIAKGAARSIVIFCFALGIADETCGGGPNG